MVRMAVTLGGLGGGVRMATARSDAAGRSSPLPS